MDGVVNVLKPPAMTSHDVVAYLRRRLREPKAGHAGTLDPAATGVLPVCLGKATRLSEYFLPYRKTYRAEMTLGAETDTGDLTGRVAAAAERVTVGAREVAAVMESFVGEYLQVPPMTSAVRHRGRKLYELARKGVAVPDRPARPVRIYAISMVRFYAGGHPRVLFDVECSGGTYIRTLCTDVGRRLGCGAYLSFLVRTGVGPFRLPDAFTLEEISAAVERERMDGVLLPPETAIPHFPAVVLPPAWVRRVQDGVHPRDLEGAGWKEPLRQGDMVRLHAPDGRLLAVAEVRAVGGRDPRRPENGGATAGRETGVLSLRLAKVLGVEGGRSGMGDGDGGQERAE